jgi:hypothetical protein
MNRCILLDLPEALSVLIIREWLALSINDVALLDSAVCNIKLRALFLSLAYNPHTTYNIEWYLLDSMMDILRWAIPRRAQLACLYVTNALLRARGLLTLFLSMNGHALCHIVVSGNEVDCTALLEVAKWCPDVLQLEVREVKSLVQWADCLISLTRALRMLTKLSLNAQVQLSKQELATALSHCRNLEYLAIGSNAQEIPESIALPTLKTITVYSRHMSDAVMIAISQSCPNLEILNTFFSLQQFGEHQVTDEGVRAVLHGCPMLREMDIDYANRISTELRVEVYRRRNLRRFLLLSWPTMNEEFLLEVLKVSPNLTELDVARCSWITDATLIVCAQHCPLLTLV